MSDDVVARLIDKIDRLSAQVAKLEARMDEQYKLLTLGGILVAGLATAYLALVAMHH